MTYSKFENNEMKFEENLDRIDLNSEANQKTIPLLEERLVVDFTQRKTSEIVVRKVIETKIINVSIPVRSEKLIVEQISPSYKQLAIVELEEQDPLSKTEFNEKYPKLLKLANLSEDDSKANDTTVNDTSLFETVIKGEVNSIEDAYEFLNLIFSQLSDASKISKIELILRRSNIESQF